jgi:hypothetical protein
MIFSPVLPSSFAESPCCKEIRAFNPEAKVLISSGINQGGGHGRVVENRHHGLCQKKRIIGLSWPGMWARPCVNPFQARDHGPVLFFAINPFSEN